MGEYDVKVTHLYGDTYRVEAYPSARSVLLPLAAFFGLGLVFHLMQKYDLTFEQVMRLFTLGIFGLGFLGIGLILWLKPKFDRFINDGRW